MFAKFAHEKRLQKRYGIKIQLLNLHKVFFSPKNLYPLNVEGKKLFLIPQKSIITQKMVGRYYANLYLYFMNSVAMVLVFRALLPVIKSQYCAAVEVNEPQCTFPVVLFLAAVVVWVQ